MYFFFLGFYICHKNFYPVLENKSYFREGKKINIKFCSGSLKNI